MRQKNFKQRLALFLALVMVVSGVGGAVALPNDPAQGEITTHYIGIRCHEETEGNPLAEPSISRGPLRPAPDLPGFNFLEYTEEITHVYSQERQWFVQGYPCGGVGPERNLARNEAVTVAARVFHHDRDEAYYREYDRFCGDVFEDVGEDDWFFGYFYTVYNTGIMLDIEGDLFEPYAYITREDALILAVRLGIITILDDVDPDDIDISDELDPEDIDVEEDIDALAEMFGLEVIDAAEVFTDVDDDHDSLPYFTAAVTMGWVKGYDDETLRPDYLISRAETVAIFNRVMGRSISNELMLEGKNPYNDLERIHWAYGDLLGATICHDVVDWFGTGFNEGELGIVIERFVDEYGYELAPPVIAEFVGIPDPQQFVGYAYVGSVHEIVYVFTAALPIPTATKTSSPIVVQVGERTTYTITLRNAQAAFAPWHNAFVEDELPSGLAFVPGSVMVDGAPHPYELDADGRTLIVRVGSLAPGETVLVTFQATALAVGAGQTWHNKAIIGSDNYPDIPVEDDGGVYIPGDDPGPGELDITGTKSPGVTEAGIGESVTYRITATAPATNGGTIYDVVMTDLIDTSKLIFITGTVTIDGVRATVQQFSYVNRLLTVQMGNIAPGQTVTVEFRAQIRNDAFGMTIENTANIFGSSEPGGAPDTGVLVVSQLPVRDRDDDIITDSRVQLFQGRGGGYWQPDGLVWRSEVVQLFHNLLVRPIPSSGVPLPPDVPSYSWARDATLFWLGRGVIGLDANGEFGLYTYVTLDEIGRFLDHLGFDRPGWMVGSGTLTRLELANVMMLIQDRSFTPDTNNIPHNSFPDVPATHWAYWMVASVSTAHSFFRDEAGNEIWDEFQ